MTISILTLYVFLSFSFLWFAFSRRLSLNFYDIIFLAVFCTAVVILVLKSFFTHFGASTAYWQCWQAYLAQFQEQAAFTEMALLNADKVFVDEKLSDEMWIILGVTGVSASLYIVSKGPLAILWTFHCVGFSLLLNSAMDYDKPSALYERIRFEATDISIIFQDFVSIHGLPPTFEFLEFIY
jgi:hypothetical protein